MLYSTVIFLAIAGTWSAPVDDPIRVDLPVYDHPQLEQASLEPENYDVSKGTSTALGQAYHNKFGVANNILKHSTSFQQVKPGSLNVQGGDGWFSPPVTTLEGALLETEGLASKTLSAKENLQQVVAGIFQPKPIVDTITEEEKYGNTGDKFYSAGRAIVGGAEGVSNLVNSALEIPGTIIRKITRAASEKLNNLGGKLIGL
ncbi:hypothetical protein ACJJTC_018779 [Scirpophaga incertulas]